MEVRADKQRIDAILSLAGCGIDIVDDNDQVVYADSGLERRYGDWRGKKCYEYFCDLEKPCSGCCRPSPLGEQSKVIQDLDCSNGSTITDPHAKIHYTENQSMRMIGIPFHDESGQWLYARIHISQPEETAAAGTKAVQTGVSADAYKYGSSDR
jgi:hypothetical protein